MKRKSNPLLNIKFIPLQRYKKFFNNINYVDNFQLGTTEIYGLAVLPAGLGQLK